MFNKKTPQANLESKRSIALLLGLVIALSSVFIALEWSKKDVKMYVYEEGEIPIEIQQTFTPPPPPPPPPPAIVEQIKMVENHIETASQPDFNSEDYKDEKIVILPPVPVEEVIDDWEVIIDIPDKMPEFQGNVFQFLSKNIRYPVIAQENGIEGRVVCQFVVNRDGTIVDIQVVRSADPSLEKEAVRVIQFMPKWKPGEQKGKTVRVKYTLPINFKLQK